MPTIKTQTDVDSAIVVLSNKDPDLARAVAFVQAAGLVVPPRRLPDGFAGLVEIIISQLVSKSSAKAIHTRFVEYINPLAPQTYLQASNDVWRKIGLTQAKHNSISILSQSLINRELKLELLHELPASEAANQLMAIKGIGPWTAEVYLLSCTGHPDIFPAGDLALREAARHLWGLDNRLSIGELKIHAQNWSPWQSIAARILWSYYAACKQSSSGQLAD